jgi:hypothetical protein
MGLEADRMDGAEFGWNDIWGNPDASISQEMWSIVTKWYRFPSRSSQFWTSTDHFPTISEQSSEDSRGAGKDNH